MRWLLFSVILVGGCSTFDVCNYHLAKNGWYPAMIAPPELVSNKNQMSIWFTNSSGDFLACAKLKSEGICGNIYELYKKEMDGEYQYLEIVCLQ